MSSRLGRARTKTTRLYSFIFLFGVIYGQDSSNKSLDDILLDDNIDFAFDDSIFNSPFETEQESSKNDWLDNFTIKVSQQLYSQINHHRIPITPTLSIDRKRDLEINRLGTNVRYQNVFAPGWLLQASAQLRLHWAGDYQSEVENKNFEWEFRGNELFLQRSFANQTIKLGRQTVVWGETLGNSVLDVININEFRDFSIIDIEDARLNQWLLVWDFFGDDSDFSSFINFFPEFNPNPVRGSPFFFEMPFDLTEYDREGDLIFEVGTKWKRSFKGSDVSLMAAYLYENQLSFDVPSEAFKNPKPKVNDFVLFGFSVNRALGKLLLNLDIAYSHDVLLGSFNFLSNTSMNSGSSSKANRLGTSFGFEYAVNNNQNISIGIQAQKLTNIDSTPFDNFSGNERKVFGSWLARYSNAFNNGNLTVSSTLQGDLKGESLLALMDVTYNLNDKWAISTQIISISAADNSPLFLFSEDVRLGATVSFSF
ncbi:MAG: hypothetical protein CL926_10875 [Deltaproteobacteria bacterium]|nr:hypothetical protein [Deltaproteobacteria bacterium]